MASRSFKICKHHSDARLSSMTQCTPPQFRCSILAGGDCVNLSLLEVLHLFLGVDEKCGPIVEEIVSKSLGVYQPCFIDTLSNVEGNIPLWVHVPGIFVDVGLMQR